MKYIIMADGKMTRWSKECKWPKHLIKIDEETLLERLVRQLTAIDPNCQIIITSHDARYEIEGATRYEPLNNVLEVDRFTWELIEDHVCFLYGDTFYTDKAMEAIVNSDTEELYFVGNRNSIIAVIVGNAAIMREHIRIVRERYLTGEISQCKGWQVYQSFNRLPFDTIEVTDNFLLIEDETRGFNTLEEYEEFLSKR